MKRLFLIAAALMMLLGLDLTLLATPRVSGAYEPAFDGMPRRRRHRRQRRPSPPKPGDSTQGAGNANQTPAPPTGDSNVGGGGGNDNGGSGKVEGPDAIQGTQEGPAGAQKQSFTGSDATRPASAPGNANRNVGRGTAQPNKNTPPAVNANSTTPPERQKQ